MSLLYDEGQLAIATESRRVLEARRDDAALLLLLEDHGRYHDAYWNTAREQGWCGIAIPEEHGGLGLGLVELGIIAHQIGRSLAGAPFLTGSFGVARALLALGDRTLKAEWLPRLASGEAIGAVAFAEKQAVIPARSALAFTGSTLTGVKPAVSGGAYAHVAVVLASDNGEPVLALAALGGVTRTTLATYDNSRCAADLDFASTPAAELARGDAALATARQLLALQAVVTAHEQTGGAEALMEKARDYALTRRAFGQPIGAFQSVKHRIAELYGLVELARAGALHAAARDGEDDFLRAAAAARIQATEAYDTAARDCVQVHGGIGVTWESGLHLHMRRTRTLANEQGNLLFWEDVLVDELERAVA
jgi:acyl-CoA dehydrogenase